jgi:predicted nucleotidyltransferase
VAADPAVLAIGYFGSYARGDAGVGSDLDLLVVVRESTLPFERRSATLDLESLPVPAEALVYTFVEWNALRRDRTRFSRMLHTETRWLVGAAPDS